MALLAYRYLVPRGCWKALVILSRLLSTPLVLVVDLAACFACSSGRTMELVLLLALALALALTLLGLLSVGEACFLRFRKLKLDKRRPDLLVPVTQG